MKQHRQKLAVIQTFPNFIDSALNLLVYPLASAFAFIFIYPLFSKFAFQYWSLQQVKLKQIKIRIENETPLTVEKAREIRQKLSSLQSEFHDELNERELEIENLKAKVDSMQVENEQLQKKIGQAKNRYSTELSPNGFSNMKENEESKVSQQNLDLLVFENDDSDKIEAFFRTMVDAGLPISPQDIERLSGLNSIRVENTIDRLNQLGVVQIDDTMPGEFLVSLTKTGKNFALRHGYA
ncbi:hypothetical protein KEHDKFFH_15060 [Marinobacter maroccanus]|uniref:Uncharacterized protein n=1 Tax=Marinobacter maroccanus TaxID=2055143 RepID=A0A2S5Z7E5_9GAMM|nr:hypothetical protein [Marinobacter maroccanus]PPI83287.1 hypothetical protein KEHDKFFH_15060 [Marinobacter maroccanus]